MPEIVVIGGGVIGLTLAYELAGQGARVTLLEQGQIGREASWAGAGILPPGNAQKAATPLERLQADSAGRWPGLSAQLREETGIDNGFFQCGGIELPAEQGPGRIDALAEEWRTAGVAVELLTGPALRKYSPELNEEIAAAVLLPELCQVRNPRHLKALIAGCTQRGVQLVAGATVVDVDPVTASSVRVRTLTNTYEAESCCVTAGSWTSSLLARVGANLTVYPVRGQIVQVSMQPLPFRHVIEVGPRYLVPRPDGRILIGSTEEQVGFDKRNTAGVVASLMEFGCEMFPVLREAKFEQAWSGLRPATADRLPYLGRVPETENVFVAAGHFRGGLQLSPATGVLMRQLMLGQELDLSLEDFRCTR